MIHPPNLVSIAVFLALITQTSAHSGAQPQKPDQAAKPELSTFERLLNQVDPPALHAALHNFQPKKFQHGMFQEDRTAVEYIHKEEPSLATSIIQLAKRQDTNSTTPTTSAVIQLPSSTPPSTPPESQGSSQASQPAASSPAIVPVGGSSEPSAPSTPSTPSAEPSPSSAPTSAPFPLSSSSPSPSIDTGSSPASQATGAAPVSSPQPFSSGAVSTGSPSTSSPPVTSSAAVFSSDHSFTTGEVLTTTNAKGYIVISTVGGGVHTITPSGLASSAKPGESLTSTYLQVSTLSNGAQETVTAVTVVGVAGSGEAAPSGVTGSGPTGTRASPGLQTGEAVMTRGFGWEGVGVLIGAVGFAVMM